MPWLLDTNVLSELRRPKPEQRVVAFVAGCPLEQLYISTVTLAEIGFGSQQCARAWCKRLKYSFPRLCSASCSSERVYRKSSKLKARSNPQSENSRFDCW